MEVHEDGCSAFLLDDVLLEAQVQGMLVPSEVVLEVEVLEVVLLVVLPCGRVVLEVIEVDLVVVVALVVVVLVVAQLLEDDAVRLEVEDPERGCSMSSSSSGCCTCRSRVAMFCFWRLLKCSLVLKSMSSLRCSQ